MNPSKRNKPLQDIRVLDIATFVAAPFASAIMSEFGAEVIKVEQPGVGDPLRRFGTPTEKTPDTYCWLSEGRNKKSITLDLKKADGAELLKRLVAKSDVVCENFRPGTLEKWGLGYEALKAINPRLIMLRISGFGQTGPLRDRTGFARIAHAFGGLAHLTGMPGGPPLTPGSTSLADYVTGLYGALGVMLALRARDNDGIGQYVDLALYEPVFRVLDDMLPTYFAKGVERGRQGLGTSNACPHGHFRSKDGKWLAIACTSDRMFQRLAEVMKLPRLADADSFGTTAARLAHHEEIDGKVQAWLSGMTAEEAVAICAEKLVPCALVNSVADIYGNPQFEARENYVSMEHEILGAIPIPGVLPKLSETPGEIRTLGPALGDSNEDILGNLLGLSGEDLVALRRAGTI